MKFLDFCKKTAEYLHLDLVSLRDPNSKSTETCLHSNKYPNPPYHVYFTDSSLGENTGHLEYVAEIYSTTSGFYLGSVAMETQANDTRFEHFEHSVDPQGEYDEHNNPAEEATCELWQFYKGKNLKAACNSFIKGGTRTNKNRKPIRVW